MYRLLGLVVSIVMNRFLKLNVISKENLPASGGLIVVCTHKGWVEVVCLGMALLPKTINYMAKQELFKNKLSGWILKRLHAFPVNRRSPGPSVFKTPLKLLSKNCIIGIFPTGTRNNDSLKRGAVAISQAAKVPIVPAIYSGPPTLRLKYILNRQSACIVFGKPIAFNEYESCENSQNKKQIQLKTMEKLNDVFLQLSEGIKSLDG